MRNMNEYQIRDAHIYNKSIGRLALIVEALNELDLGDVTEFKMQPIPEACDFVPRWIEITALIQEGPIAIYCERNGYGMTDRWEFKAIGWPEYQDESGKTCTIDPSSLWNPRASRPSTTAAQDRAPAAIAKQIASKIIPEYIEVYKRCLGRAEAAQDYSNERAEGLRRLAAACKDDRNEIVSHNGSARNSFYIRELKGDAVSVDSASHGDVRIKLHTDEMIPVIALIRELRA